MHKLIKQIAEQTGVTVITTKGNEFVRDGCYIVSPDRLEQFANAIIQECVIVARKADNEDKLYSWYALEQHFGS